MTVTICFQTAQKNHYVKTIDSSSKNDHYEISYECKSNLSQPMLNRAVNGSEQKASKIRIKVNTNKSLSGNTAAIYSGLGLDISPSSSMEDSLDGTAGTPVPELLPDESPRTIFEVKFCTICLYIGRLYKIDFSELTHCVVRTDNDLPFYSWRMLALTPNRKCSRTETKA